MVRGDVQAGVDRSKKEVEVEQDGFLLLGGGQGGRQVDRQGRAAHAAGGARDRDDPGPCSLVVCDSFRPRASREMISSTSAGSAGSVRNSRAPARMAFKIKPLSELRLAGNTIAPGLAW